jgi:anti-anti-sigma factor
MSNADMLEEVIRRLCTDGVKDLVLDLNQLVFMDSTGLRVVLTGYGLCQEHSCGFLVRPGHSAARRLLEVSGTLDILPLDESQGE